MSLENMSMANKIDIDEKSKNFIVASYIESLVRMGALDISNKSENEILAEVKKVFKNSSINVVVDYRQDLLKNARSFYNLSEYKLSCLLYATWFEHWINSVISTLSERSKINEKHKVQMIKEVSFSGKYTWLLSIFNFRPINRNHLKRILKVAELRNGFVHYKWKPADEDNEKAEEEVLKGIENTIKYLNNYENKYILNSTKKRLRKIVK